MRMYRIITETAERVTKERLIGKDPETGRTVLTRLSRRGPVIQLGAPDELATGRKAALCQPAKWHGNGRRDVGDCA